MPLRGVQSEDWSVAQRAWWARVPCALEFSTAILAVANASVFMWPGKVRSMPKHQDWWYGYSRAKGLWV
jgi:hypothetical protein